MYYSASQFICYWACRTKSAICTKSSVCVCARVCLRNGLDGGWVSSQSPSAQVHIERPQHYPDLRCAANKKIMPARRSKACSHHPAPLARFHFSSFFSDGMGVLGEGVVGERTNCNCLGGKEFSTERRAWKCVCVHWSYIYI